MSCVRRDVRFVVSLTAVRSVRECHPCLLRSLLIVYCKLVSSQSDFMPVLKYEYACRPPSATAQVTSVPC